MSGIGNYTKLLRNGDLTDLSLLTRWKVVKKMVVVMKMKMMWLCVKAEETVCKDPDAGKIWDPCVWAKVAQ